MSLEVKDLNLYYGQKRALNSVNMTIPEKKVSLIITSPGFSSASVNSGRVRLALKEVAERDRSQKEIAADLTASISLTHFFRWKSFLKVAVGSRIVSAEGMHS